MSQILTGKELTRSLNQLCDTASDTHLGYQTAAEKVENKELKSLFADYAIQREKFVTQLQALTPLNGEELPNDEPTAGGKLQAGWIGFREAINWESEKVVLAEVAKMEEHAIGKLEGILKPHNLPSPIADEAQHQLKLYREGAARAQDIYKDPNMSDKGMIPGTHGDGSGTTPAGRATIPSA